MQQYTAYNISSSAHGINMQQYTVYISNSARGINMQQYTAAHIELKVNLNDLQHMKLLMETVEELL